jgi:hypothetical protein
MLPADAFDKVSIANVALKEDRIRVHGVSMPAGKVVENNYVLSRVDEIVDRHTSNVSGTAGNQNRHINYVSSFSNISMNSSAILSGVSVMPYSMFARDILSRNGILLISSWIRSAMFAGSVVQYKQFSGSDR